MNGRTEDNRANDDWLERALAEHGHAHRDEVIADDGFSLRVVSALPTPLTLPAWRKPVVAALWAAAAGALAIALPGTLEGVGREVLRMIGSVPVSLWGMAMGVALLGAATCTAAAVALRQS